MSRENVELVRRNYEAFSRGDFDAWLESVREDAELHEVSDIPDSAVYRGHAGRPRSSSIRGTPRSWFAHE